MAISLLTASNYNTFTIQIKKPLPILLEKIKLQICHCTFRKELEIYKKRKADLKCLKLTSSAYLDFLRQRLRQNSNVMTLFCLKGERVLSSWKGGSKIVGEFLKINSFHSSSLCPEKEGRTWKQNPLLIQFNSKVFYFSYSKVIQLL